MSRAGEDRLRKLLKDIEKTFDDLSKSRIEVSVAVRRELKQQLLMAECDEIYHNIKKS